MDKQIEVRSYDGNYSTIQKEKILIHAATWLNLDSIMLSEKSETQKITYYMIQIIIFSRKGKLRWQKDQ